MYLYVEKLTVFSFHMKISFEYLCRNDIGCKKSDNLNFEKENKNLMSFLNREFYYKNYFGIMILH